MTEKCSQTSYEEPSWNNFATQIMDLLDDLPETIFTTESNKIRYARTFKLSEKHENNLCQTVYLVLDKSTQTIYFGFKKVKAAYLSKPTDENIVNQGNFKIDFQEINSFTDFRRTMKDSVGLDFFAKQN